MMKRLRAIIEIYEQEAEFWERSRSQSPFSEIKYMKLVLARIPSGSEILDVGCGSGQPIAEYFLQQGFAVTGIDAAQAMIQKAKAKFPEGVWFKKDMRSLDLHKKFSAIVAWDSFFHLTSSEQIDMFPIFKNHLLPGGLLLFTSGPRKGEAIGDMNGQALYHSSLDPNEYRDLFLRHGLEEICFSSEDPECGGHTVWLCRALNHP